MLLLGRYFFSQWWFYGSPIFNIVSKLATEGKREWRIMHGRFLWVRLRVAIDHFQLFFINQTLVIWPHLATRKTEKYLPSVAFDEEEIVGWASGSLQCMLFNLLHNMVQSIFPTHASYTFFLWAMFKPKWDIVYYIFLLCFTSGIILEVFFYLKSPPPNS